MQFFPLRFSFWECGKWKKFLIFPSFFPHGGLSSSPRTIFHGGSGWSLASLKGFLPLEIAEKLSGIAIFEYSWFGLLLWNSACFKGRGLWEPVQSRLKHGVSTLAAELTDAELALLLRAMPSPTQTLSGAHHSILNTQNKTRGSKPSNLFYHFDNPWNVVCWPLVVIQATRDVACLLDPES